MKAPEWLKEAIMDYVSNNSDKKLTSTDIVAYFSLPEQVMTSLKELIEEKKIQRVNQGVLEGWSGQHFYKIF